MQYAETIHDMLQKEKDLNLKFDFDFPSGPSSEPPQISRISKGLPVQAADHEAVRKAMATRGVVRFASNLGAADGDAQKAKTQFATPQRDVVLVAVSKNLMDLADLYSNRKMDMPRRGNALCTEAAEAIELLPAASREKKELDARVKKELKRFVVKS
jgi:hypothetical protein